MTQKIVQNFFQQKSEPPFIHTVENSPTLLITSHGDCIQFQCNHITMQALAEKNVPYQNLDSINALDHEKVILIFGELQLSQMTTIGIYNVSTIYYFLKSQGYFETPNLHNSDDNFDSFIHAQIAEQSLHQYFLDKGFFLYLSVLIDLAFDRIKTIPNFWRYRLFAFNIFLPNSKKHQFEKCCIDAGNHILYENITRFLDQIVDMPSFEQNSKSIQSIFDHTKPFRNSIGMINFDLIFHTMPINIHHLLTLIISKTSIRNSLLQHKKNRYFSLLEKEITDFNKKSKSLLLDQKLKQLKNITTFPAEPDILNELIRQLANSTEEYDQWISTIYENLQIRERHLMRLFHLHDQKSENVQNFLFMQMNDLLSDPPTFSLLVSILQTDYMYMFGDQVSNCCTLFIDHNQIKLFSLKMLEKVQLSSTLIAYLVHYHARSLYDISTFKRICQNDSLLYMEKNKLGHLFLEYAPSLSTCQDFFILIALFDSYTFLNSIMKKITHCEMRPFRRNLKKCNDEHWRIALDLRILIQGNFTTENEQNFNSLLQNVLKLQLTEFEGPSIPIGLTAPEKEKNTFMDYFNLATILPIVDYSIFMLPQKSIHHKNLRQKIDNYSHILISNFPDTKPLHLKSMHKQYDITLENRSLYSWKPIAYILEKNHVLIFIAMFEQSWYLLDWTVSLIEPLEFDEHYAKLEVKEMLLTLQSTALPLFQHSVDFDILNHILHDYKLKVQSTDLCENDMCEFAAIAKMIMPKNTLTVNLQLKIDELKQSTYKLLFNNNQLSSASKIIYLESANAKNTLNNDLRHDRFIALATILNKPIRLIGCKCGLDPQSPSISFVDHFSPSTLLNTEKPIEPITIAAYESKIAYTLKQWHFFPVQSTTILSFFKEWIV